MNKSISKASLWVPLVIAVAFVAGMWTTVLLNREASGTPGQKKLNQVMALIEERYVDELETDSLVERTLPHLLEALDPHSVYIAANDLKAVNDDLEGTFSGVGVSFMLISDTISVVEIIPNGPADRAGMLAGDRIVTIDGKKVAGVGMDSQKVFSLLRGPKGTNVRLGVQRHGVHKLLQYDLVRGDIPVTSIDAAYMLRNGVGYIKVNKFSRATYGEFLSALNRLKVEGHADSYIIDLRGNGGGFMEMAILMANEFLAPYSTIVETRGRDSSANSVVLSDGTGHFQDADIIVLIDEFSASSSEILAGALQDNDRALVLGRRSFGKGLVQQQFVLPDSSALRLTVQRYYTPSGRCIQKDYKPGENIGYEAEIVDRFNNGETLNADSVKFNKDKVFHTLTGRVVYGGGGIMPDIFVPNDTTGITGYYMAVANAGLLQKFSYEYCNLNRETLGKAKTVNQLLAKLPSDDMLLQAFVHYASQNKIPARWYYISQSANLLTTQLKGLIARDILGTGAYYEVTNTMDGTVNRALEEIKKGSARPPLKPVETVSHIKAGTKEAYRPNKNIHKHVANQSTRRFV